MKLSEIQDSKAIVCSDLHIDDYKEYNPTEKQLDLEKDINPLNFSNKDEYRLNQILMIAKRIVYECIKYNTHTVFILGDLINRPNALPVVLNTLKLFIKTITDENITIYYILGQHDLKVRKMDCDIRKDTFVGTMRNSHFKYSHGKQYNMGKHIVEFKNFDFDNECKFKDNSTVLLGHISLGMGQSPIGKSAKLCVAGDIHDIVDKTINGIECHSCMTPFVIYPHQSMNGYIGLLDCSKDKPTYERISSSGKIILNNKEVDFKLFDILQSTDYKKSVLSEQLKSIRDKDISIDDENTDEISDRFDFKNQTNIENTVKKIAIENDFEDLFSELVLEEMPKPLDFNFKLLTLDIENVKSIKKMHIDFNNINGITYLSGRNGAGKSTVIKSVETALVGDKRIKSLLRKNETNLLLDLSLEYHDSIYRIVRKVGKTEFYINDEKQTLGKKDTEEAIIEKLPFIEYLSYFICHANSHFFDSVDRTELIMDIFNLNSLNYYREAIEDLQDSIKDNIKDESVNKTVCENQIKDLKDDKKKVREKIDSLNNMDIKIISDAKTKLKEFNDLISEIKNSMSICDSYKSSIESLEKSIQNDTNESKYIKAKDCLKQIDSCETIKSKLNSQKSVINSKKNELNSSIAIRQKLLATPKCKCPECEHEFYLNGIDDKIKEYDIEISQKQKEIEKLENEFEFLSTGVTEIETEYSKSECNLIISKYEASKQLKEKLSTLKEKQEEEKKKGVSNYTIKQSILESNSCKKDSEYIQLLNDSIELSIKKESYENELSEIKNKLNKYSKRLEDIETKLKKLNKKINKCEKFRSLFDMENLNSIPYKIINKVIHSLDNDKIRFKSTKELANGEDRFEINVEINVDGEWIDYNDASDGQKILLDSFILYSILTNLDKVGLLILDEYMCNADNENVEFISLVISKMNRYVSNTLITSHSDYFNRYDNLMQLKLDNGVTVINN